MSNALAVPSKEQVSNIFFYTSNYIPVILLEWLYKSVFVLSAVNLAIHKYDVVSHKRTVPLTEPVAIRLLEIAATVVS